MNLTYDVVAAILKRLDAIEAKLNGGNADNSTGCCGGGSGSLSNVTNKAMPQGSVEKFPLSESVFVNVQRYSLPSTDSGVPYQATTTWLSDKHGNKISGQYCHCSGKNCTGSSWCDTGTLEGCNCETDCTVYCT